MTEHVRVLDKGYVRLLGHLGDDLTVVNAARVSYEKRSTWEYAADPESPAGFKRTLQAGDARLIHYLTKHGHTTPFRHCTIQFEVKAPLLVARQWWRYVVGSDHTMDGWNEQSRRYVDSAPEFYIPAEWHGRATANKQGSAGALDAACSNELSTQLQQYVIESAQRYRDVLDCGVAAEQARLFLPAYALYTTWQWTASLQSVAYFLAQRLDEHAQWEIRQYAQVIRTLATPLFPIALPSLLEHLQ